MKRQILAGVALAGALSLWAGAAAFASEDSGDQAEALLQQAEGFTATASDAVSNCAEARISTFENTSAPSGVNADAWEQAVETANETVLGIVEKTQAQLESKLDTFAKAVDAADENGIALPTIGTFQQDLNAIATAACQAIGNVNIIAPASGSTSEPDNERDTERDTEHDTASAGIERD